MKLKNFAMLNAPIARRAACAIIAMGCAFVLLGCSLFNFGEKTDTSYRFGRIEEHSLSSTETLLKDSYFYSDGWFFDDPEARNDELALMSMQLVAASSKNESDGRGEAAVRELGFDEVGFETFYDDPWGDCAYVWGKKTINDGFKSYTLVAVVIQAYSTDPEIMHRAWVENVTVNSEDQTTGEAYGWGHAAEHIMDSVVGLGGSGKVKYLICGQSRGGAITNILSAHLLDELGSRNGGIYAYAFEPPMTVDGDIDNAPYGYIHNYVCADDIVTIIPPWGMTRYGVVHDIKSETDAGLHDELVKLGSDVANTAVTDTAELNRSFVDQLVRVAPTRADYSAAQNVAFTDSAGNPVSFTYTYQEVLQSLVDVIFGGELPELSLESLLYNIDDLLPFATAFNRAVQLDLAGDAEGAAPYYWTAAQSLRGALVSMSATGNLSMTDPELYGLLKAVGPAIVNTSFETLQGSGSSLSLLGNAAKLLALPTNVQSMIYSHLYDTIIARLKVLAPQPVLDHINIEIETPVEGDAPTKAPEEIAANVAALDQPWLTAQAQWESKESLVVTLTAVGHSASEDLQLTLNGAAPAQPLEISYQDGASVIRAVYAF